MGMPRPERGYWTKLLVGQKAAAAGVTAPEPFENVEWPPVVR